MVFVAAPFATALDPTLRLSQYQKRHWQVEDGLPQNYVTAIRQSPAGYLLVGTAGGVARFDGVRFTPVVLQEENGAWREWITSLVFDREGALWIASRDAGVFVHAHGETRALSQRPADFATFSLDASGAVAGFGGLGVFRWESGRFVNVASGFGRTDLSWQGLAAEGDGSLLVACERGVFRITPGRVSRLAASTRRTGSVFSVTRDRQGLLWIGAAAGLFQVPENGEAPPRKIDGVQGPVTNILTDRDGSLWAATWGRGIYRVTATGVARWNSADGLPDDFVHSLFEDREGNLWIGGRSGLSRWKDAAVVPYGPAEGLLGKFASSVTGDRSGKLWLGTWRSGLYRYQADRPERVPTPLPELFFLTRALACDRNRGLWLGSESLYELDGLRWRTHGPLPLRPPYRAIVFDERGHLWIAASNGVIEYPDGRPSTTAVVPHLRGATAFALQPQRDAMWVATNCGVMRIRGDRAEKWTTKEGLPSDTVTSVSIDSSDRVWVTTKANGISLIEGSRIRTLDQRSGLPALPFHAVLDDGLGSLWLSSPAGIYSVPLREIADVLAGRAATVGTVRYDQEDGLRSIECHGEGSSSGWRDANGLLWFATLDGFVRIDPRLLRVRRPAPEVILESVEVQGRPVPLQERLVLKPGTRDLAVRFTTPLLASPGQVSFRYRIDGVDRDWVEIGGTRILRYSSIPAGVHRLTVAAREARGPWSETGGTSIEIEQRPEFYETVWFAGVGVAGFGAVLLLIYRWRMYLLKSRYAAVIAERNRIAREWHDTLLAGFAAISWQLDATLQRLQSGTSGAIERVQIARTMIHHYRAEARRVIWDLRHDGPDLESLPVAITQALEQIAQGTGVQTHVTVHGTAMDLPVELSQNLLRICQEAATNAVRHGDPKEIHASIAYRSNEVVASIRDDGSGFDAASAQGGPAGHFGLEIMRERANRFGGNVEVVSTPSAGTVVNVVIPYPA